MIRRVRLDRRFAERFVREAKRIFPLEHFVYLLGSKGRGNEWVVREVVWPLPNDLTQEPSGLWVCPTQPFLDRALQEASHLGLELIGDLHSHCFGVGDITHSNPVPSYQDFVRQIPKSYKVFGICELRRMEDGKIKRKITFWRSEPPLTVTR